MSAVGCHGVCYPRSSSWLVFCSWFSQLLGALNAPQQWRLFRAWHFAIEFLRAPVAHSIALRASGAELKHHGVDILSWPGRKKAF
eukprot:12910847-Prorocentrum_lima.AAC.1